MTAVIAIICLIGIATDILFIKSEYDEDMKKAVWLKEYLLSVSLLFSQGIFFI